MTDGVDDDELRDLRAKAYGPGGRLTDAEARRLQELEALVRGTGAERPGGADANAVPLPDGRPAGGDAPDSLPSGGAPVPAGARAEGIAWTADSAGDAGSDDRAAAAEAAEADATAPAEDGARRGIRTRRWFPYAAVGLVLLIGFGIGFVVFGQSVLRSVALSLAVGAEQVALEADGDYDPGSITPLGQSHGATIWRATRDEGEEQCLLLTLDEQSESNCVPSEQFGQQNGGLYASLNMSAGEGDDASELSVSVVRDIHGDLVVVAQVYDPNESWDWRSQYTEEELAIVDRIESETGISGESLQLVGYDGDRPVWQDYSGSSACVIVAVVGSVERACADDANATVVLEIANPDGTVTGYRVTMSDRRGPMLTIERESSAGTDAAIDDKTGDVEP
ncbi:hypothetical protein [Microbacterium sp. GXF0217]